MPLLSGPVPNRSRLERAGGALSALRPVGAVAAGGRGSRLAASATGNGPAARLSASPSERRVAAGWSDSTAGPVLDSRGTRADERGPGGSNQQSRLPGSASFGADFTASAAAVAAPYGLLAAVRPAFEFSAAPAGALAGTEVSRTCAGSRRVPSGNGAAGTERVAESTRRAGASANDKRLARRGIPLSAGIRTAPRGRAPVWRFTRPGSQRASVSAGNGAAAIGRRTLESP